MSRRNELRIVEKPGRKDWSTSPSGLVSLPGLFSGASCNYAKLVNICYLLMKMFEFVISFQEAFLRGNSPYTNKLASC